LLSYLQALEIALLACATLAHKPPQQWLVACVEHAMTIVADFDAQAVANIMWSLTFLGYLPSHLWSALMKPFGDALLGIKGN
jgi:hypothetical protein